MSWSLFEKGAIVAKGAEQKCDYLGWFHVGPGKYVLNVEISRDGHRFNSFNPRLVVFESGGIKEDAESLGVFAYWAFFVLLTLGAGHAACAGILSRNGKLNSVLTEWPLTHPQSGSVTSPNGMIQRPIATAVFRPDRRSYGRYPLSGLSSIALMSWTVFLLSAIGMAFLHSLSGYHFPVGIPMNITLPSEGNAESHGSPVLVQLRLAGSAGRRPDLYLNWKPVAWEDFEALLRKELNSRPPDWPVYLDGDPDLEVEWVIKVADAIRGLHDRVTLLARPMPSRREQIEPGHTQADVPTRGRHQR